LEKKFSNIKNFTVATEEANHSVIFLRKIIQGSTDKSFGIHVGKLAGMPQVVLERAHEILSDLEAKKPKRPIQWTKKCQQVSFLTSQKDKEATAWIEQIQAIDPNTLSPLDALNLLAKWKNEIRSK
jgi:DNA mismatch repair protein MutS